MLMRHLGYLAAVAAAVLGLVVLFTGGFGLTEHSVEAAVGLIVLSLAITLWQRSRDQRTAGRRP